jgi:hypothetical protein
MDPNSPIVVFISKERTEHCVSRSRIISKGSGILLDFLDLEKNPVRAERYDTKSQLKIDSMPVLISPTSLSSNNEERFSGGYLPGYDRRQRSGHPSYYVKYKQFVLLYESDECTHMLVDWFADLIRLENLTTKNLYNLFQVAKGYNITKLQEEIQEEIRRLTGLFEVKEKEKEKEKVAIQTAIKNNVEPQDKSKEVNVLTSASSLIVDESKSQQTKQDVVVDMGSLTIEAETPKLKCPSCLGVDQESQIQTSEKEENELLTSAFESS